MQIKCPRKSSPIALAAFTPAHIAYRLTCCPEAGSESSCCMTVFLEDKEQIIAFQVAIGMAARLRNAASCGAVVSERPYRHLWQKNMLYD